MSELVLQDNNLSGVAWSAPAAARCTQINSNTVAVTTYQSFCQTGSLALISACYMLIDCNHTSLCVLVWFVHC
jgi:hypothetical protein